MPITATALDVMTALKLLRDVAAERDPLGTAHDIATELIREFDNACYAKELSTDSTVELRPSLHCSQPEDTTPEFEAFERMGENMTRAKKCPWGDD